MPGQTIGVLVSDAAPMIGMTSRVPEDEAVVEFIKAGGDAYLFARREVDFPNLLQAVHEGRLSEERVYESAQRMLDMKETLRLDEANFSPAPTAALESPAGEVGEVLHSTTKIHFHTPFLPILRSGCKIHFLSISNWLQGEEVSFSAHRIQCMVLDLILGSIPRICLRN